jgi:hypothetical protein
MFDDPTNLLGMYLLALGPIGFLFGICSACCSNECRTFSDPLTIRVGTKVSWPNSTAAFDTDLNPVTLSAGVGMVLSLHDFGGPIYALVEYESGGTQQAYIAVNDLTKEIDDWWEICSGSWRIDSSKLESLSSGSMTFLITEPTPYGTFTAEVDAVEDVEYRMFVRRGDDADDECGADDLTIKWEYLGTDWQITVGDGTPFLVFSPANQVRIGVCVDEKGVAVIFDGVRVFQRCVVPGGYYFAIGASAAGTLWANFEYSDHYDNNPNCPRCQPSCCFQNFSETIEGFDITITGIGNGADCECNSTIEAYIPLTVNGICFCEVQGTVTLSYPGGAFFVCESTQLTVSLLCDTNFISLGVELLHNTGSETTWSDTFAAGTAPGDVKMTSRAVDSADEGFVCDHTNSLITATPRVTTGCCGGEPEEENPLP